MSVILFGVGKSLIAASVFWAGRYPSGVISNPANSTVSLAKWNFSLLNTMPLSAHVLMYSKVCQNAVVISSSHSSELSMHRVTLSWSLFMSSNLRVYASPDAWNPIGARQYR